MYGAFLLAVYNQDAEEFQTISKIGTGFSEEQLKQFSEQLKEFLVPSAKPYYRSAVHARIPLLSILSCRFVCPRLHISYTEHFLGQS